MKLCSELIFLVFSVENKFRKFYNIPLRLKKEMALWTLLFLFLLLLPAAEEGGVLFTKLSIAQRLSGHPSAGGMWPVTVIASLFPPCSSLIKPLYWPKSSLHFALPILPCPGGEGGSKQLCRSAAAAWVNLPQPPCSSSTHLFFLTILVFISCIFPPVGVIKIMWFKTHIVSVIQEL